MISKQGDLPARRRWAQAALAPALLRRRQCGPFALSLVCVQTATRCSSWGAQGWARPP